MSTIYQTAFAIFFREGFSCRPAADRLNAQQRTLHQQPENSPRRAKPQAQGQTTCLKRKRNTPVASLSRKRIIWVPDHRGRGTDSALLGSLPAGANLRIGIEPSRHPVPGRLVRKLGRFCYHRKNPHVKLLLPFFPEIARQRGVCSTPPRESPETKPRKPFVPG